MLKTISILILLITAGRGVLSEDGDGSTGLIDGHISVLPFDPIGFTNFILLIISLPFRILGAIFGAPLELAGVDVSGGLTTDVSGGFLGLPQSIGRFMEEIFHFIRLLLDRIFGNLEGGAAIVAGDGSTSQTYRENRNGSSNTTMAES